MGGMGQFGKAALLVLDGFGIGKHSPFNAIDNAKMPFYRDLLKKYPHSQLMTHGEHVGLPSGVMGNSEVGHTTLGAGQILFQSLARIHRSVKDRTFFKMPKLLEFLKGSERVHAMGLLSDAGVHSDLAHLLAFLEAAHDAGVVELSVHAILDGRDTPPDSGAGFLERLLEHPLWKNRPPGWCLASMAGRYFAMDRDQRQERIDQAVQVLWGNATPVADDPVAMLRNSYATNPKGDEFFPPTLLESQGAIRRGDRVFFFNFRADRARQIAARLTAPNAPKLSRFLGMTLYDEAAPLDCLFPPEKPENTFGELVSRAKLKQFRIAETEKYAHVTFFFNGGQEAVFPLEDRLLIPSPKDVETYDQKPEMSAPEIADAVAERARTSNYSFMLMNFANADMVGHTGNYSACVKAMEALDQCLAKVIGALHSSDFHILLTADHGNAEEMQDHEGRPHTQHTLNPVPAIWITPNSANAPKAARQKLNDGGLKDVMPTLCQAMGLSIPKTVQGRSLLQC